MVTSHLYVAQYVICLEEQWHEYETTKPIRIEKQYRLDSQLYLANDREHAFQLATHWLPGFSDSNHDGPGDLSQCYAIGIHDIEELCTNFDDLTSALREMYGVDIGGFYLPDVDSYGVPLVRDKNQMAIFRTYSSSV